MSKIEVFNLFTENGDIFVTNLKLLGLLAKVKLLRGKMSLVG